MVRKSFDCSLFRRLYAQSIEDVFQFWTSEMQAEIAKHCYPWRQGATDFKHYLVASETRYLITCETIAATGDFSSLCDVGGFFGVFPLALARMGYSVAMTEALKYYSQSFDPLFAYLRENGVRIVDYDPFDGPPPLTNEFDVISVQAVLEHYPHSLRQFMDNVSAMLRPQGRLYLEVPNIAYWPKRKELMLGRTPLVPVQDIYHSAVPFIGHHHEYTMTELQDLVALGGFKVEKANYFNYSFRGRLINRVYSDWPLTLMTLFPSMRECISVIARRPPPQ